MGRRNVVDEEVEKFGVGQAPVGVDGIEGPLESCQDSSLSFLVLVSQKTQKLLHLGHFDCLLEQHGEMLNHFDSLNEDQHVWVLQHVHDDVEYRGVVFLELYIGLLLHEFRQLCVHRF